MTDDQRPKHEEPIPAEQDSTPARRKLLKALAGAGGVFAAGKSLPEHWTRPVVDSVLLPAHAVATGAGPWSGKGMVVENGGTGPAPDRGMGERLLDAVIPPANAAPPSPPPCPDIYVCIKMLGGGKAEVLIFDCCNEGPAGAECPLSGGDQIINCNVDGVYTVTAELKNNQWVGTAKGDCCFFGDAENTGQESPFNPQRRLLAENRTPGMAGQLLDALVPKAHAGTGDGGGFQEDIWQFTLTQGGCNAAQLDCPDI